MMSAQEGFKKVDGTNKGDFKLYALSTCGWCKKTKGILNDLNVGYSYIDVDLLQGIERKETLDELRKWNPKCSFPTLVVNNDHCIVGFKEDDVREAITSAG